MQNKQFPLKTLILWQLRFLLVGLILVGACLYFATMLKILNIIALILAIIIFVIIFLYLPVFFKGYKIQLEGEAIIINYGLIVKITHIMPYSRLIYAQSFATPLARMFGMTMITLKAARSWVVIPEINKADATVITDYLSSEERNG